MRGGLSAIQQTLTPEAASVLSHAIAEASRRNHGQTTPLHVAATLLASPTGFLRQACIRSHPNSSHPLQCRALELCFSVALEQLPTAQLNPGSGPASSGDPPVSNALMAALKRAQAHKRRGCPEQQPLLAVKVELEQLIISILDDPSVSRVMREASFSSPAVKAAIEQALNNQPNSGPAGPRIGLAFSPGPQPGSLGLGTIGLAAGAGIVPPSPVSGAGGRNLYLNPRLQQNNSQVNGWMVNREDEVKKVMDILLKSKKRNPVLVGEFEPEEVVKEVLRRFEKDETHDGVLKGVEIISVVRELGADQAQLGNKVKEFEALIERKMGKGEGGVIVDLGNLKWLVDQQGAKGVSEAARGAVSEMGRMLRKHGEGSRIWFIGTATCETYLRCQVYHPSMESDWDLQVLSIVSRPPHMPGMVPRLGTNGGILSTSVECLSPMKGYTMPGPPLTRRLSENFDPSRRFSFCPQCTEQYGQELARLEAEPADKPSKEVKIDAGRQSLPPWLQNAKLHTNDKGANDLAQGKDQESMILRQKTQELQIKWSETCLQLHPGFHHNVGSERIIPSPLSMTGLYNPSLLGCQPLQPKLQQPRSLGDALQLRTPVPSQVDLERPTSKPASPVRIDLALGPTKLTQATEDIVHKERLTDFLGCVSSESQSKVHEVPTVNRPSGQGDIDSFKRLLKGLTERVWWQTDAASAVASAITQCKLGNGKRRVGGSKGDIWLLFSGADRIGKKKMATALSELLCNVSPILIALGSRRNGDESDLDFRGKTAIDRITETVRRNPFSVIMLQDIDEADMLVRGSIKRAMERGRFTDSHGREISLGNVIFIVTASWMPDQLKGLSNRGLRLSEEKLISLASGGWQLKLSIGEKASVKRPPSLLDGDRGRATKQRKDLGLGLSFDLNQMADTDDERLNGSNNSSDLTVEHEEEHGYEPRGSPTTPSAAPNDLLTAVDETIIFKPVDFTPIKHNIERTILTTFSSILGDKLSVKVESEVLEKLLSGIWLGQTAIESWAEKVLISSIQQLKATLPSLFAHSPDRKVVARLEVYQEVGSRDPGDWLPSRIAVVADAQ